MPELNVNLSEAMEFVDVPAGTYDAVVAGWTDVKTAKTSGHQMISAIYEITDGEFAGQKLFHNLMLEGKGSGFFREAWKVMTGEELPKEEDIRVNTDQAEGSQVKVIVTSIEYPEGSGEFRSQVDKILP